MKLITLTSLILLSACASITQGTTQNLSVNTIPQKKDATCTLKNEKGSWVTPAPGLIGVRKAAGGLSIVCNAPKGYSGATSVESTTQGAAYGNILLGGIIGGAVDMSSGAAYAYPSTINVPISKE